MTGSYHGASPGAIQHHYDLSDTFYALWLDPGLTYSCALWEGVADDLAAAQQRKLAHLAAQARVTRARRVLEVGCGWGSMLRHLLDEEGVDHVVGLTLSPAQAASISSWADPRCEVRLENWTDHDGGPYDGVISIGALEHFARYDATRAERLESYRAFFDRCHEWLPPRHRLVLQTNVNGSNSHLDRATVQELMFIIEKIFPESGIPWLSEIMEASQKRFDVVRMRNDPDHYARTCQAWHDRLRARRDEAAALVGEQAVADYLHYLSSTVRHFERRHLGLARIVFERYE
ncbi:cyclopropane-fatty-acyl-phospholipid synthase family protein [Spirillospora sp. NPDC047279]|uniref:cyclopropane-fatty-acyl-phospholipid synthase family protein n=1 Tax=Spirillospora sp. NPDC047279 TaxID=3155478 RepID=UPI0033E3C2EC